MRRLSFSTHGWILFFSALSLAMLGIVMVYSVTGGLLLSKHYAAIHKNPGDFPDTLAFLKNQALYVFFGITACFVLTFIPTWILHRLVKPAIVVAFLSLFAVLFLGVNVNGAHRWFLFFGISIQPMEFAKIALILYLAYIIERRAELITDPWKGFGQPIFVTGIMVFLLLLQPDLGSSVLFMFIAGLLLFLAGSRLYYFAFTAAVVIPILWYYMAAGWRLSKRIIPFLHPEYFSQGAAYQIVRSLDAFGSGGTWGYGLGEGPYKLDFLPEAHTDYIAAMIGQELGFAGIALLIFLYGCFLYAGVRIALFHRHHLFRFLLGMGLVLQLVLQAIINLSVVMNIIPSKGITLPFVSFGGSSLLVSFIALGLLLRLDRERLTYETHVSLSPLAVPQFES